MQTVRKLRDTKSAVRISRPTIAQSGENHENSLSARLCGVSSSFRTVCMHSERPLIAQLIDGYSKSQRLAGGFDAGQQLAPISALETR